MSHRTMLSLFIATFLILQIGALAGEDDDQTTLPGVQSGRLEVPDDEYVPVPIEGRQTSPAFSMQVPGFFMTQVNVDVVGYNIVGDAANEPSIAVDPTDPDRMAIGWRQFDTIYNNFRQAGWGYTTDGGQTWTFPGVIEPGVFRSDPVLDYDAEGNFFYNSLTDNWVCDVFKSTDGGATWDAGTFAQGGDKQWMAIDRTSGIGSGNIYAYWNGYYSVCSPGNFTRSTDRGLSYHACDVILEDPYWGTLTVGNDGELYVCGASDPNFIVLKSTSAQDSSQLVTWDLSTIVSLEGEIWFADGPNPGGLLGQAWIAVDHSSGPTRGNIYLLCSVNPPASNDPLEVMFSSSTDGGVTWSPAIQINDDSNNYAWQWFGTMSVAPNGRIDVIWLDTRDDPGGYDSALYYSYSRDAGVTWSENRQLSGSFDPHVGWPQQNKMGDYFHMISDSTGAHLAWAATFNGEQDVYYGYILADILVPDDYATIQGAIDASVDGNTIIVRPGTYVEYGIDFSGKAVTVRSTDPQDPGVVAATIVDADSMGGVFIFQSGEDSTSVLSGLTITGGSADFGGGIFCRSSFPTITNNIIRGNLATGSFPEGQGGGIYCDSSSAVVMYNTITGNSANTGGGIYCSDSSPTLSYNNVTDNTASIGGGGIVCSNASPSIVNNNIAGNAATLGGAGGGGLVCSSSSSATVTNTILWDNDAAEGPEIWIGGTSTCTIGYSDVEGGQASVLVEAGSTLNWGSGMIDFNPLYRDVVAEDYHLMAVVCGDSSDSPCIDAGDPGLTDLALGCDYGLGATRSDMGAYGGGGEPVAIEDDKTNMDFASLPKAFDLSQNYPNPFNPSTTIALDVPGAAGTKQTVVLTIYDIRGRHVKTLIDASLEPGSHLVHWDGRNDRGERISSGIYLYTLKAAGETFTRKMAVLK